MSQRAITSHDVKHITRHGDSSEGGSRLTDTHEHGVMKEFTDRDNELGHQIAALDELMIGMITSRTFSSEQS